MTRISLLLAVAALTACQTTYISPDAVVTGEEMARGLEGEELKRAMAEEDGDVLAAGSTGFRSACDADLCAGDIGYLDVYVSEVMADPTDCTDATGEWVEVYNRTDLSVDLNGATLEDGSSGATVTLSNMAVIPARSYAVIGKGSSSCGVDVDGTFSSSIALNNSGDNLNLRRPDGALIDNALSWPAVDAGVAFETSPEDGWRWLAATDAHGDSELASPGFGPADEGYVRPLAQVAPGFLRITEVMADPTCSWDRCEWVELYNRSGWPVDLGGLSMVDAGGNEAYFDGVVGPYEHIVVGRGDADDWTDSAFDVHSTYGNLGLNNAGEQLFLLDGDRELWATPMFPTFVPGASMTYIGYSTGEDLADWAVSTTPIPGTDDLGSPGAW